MWHEIARSLVVRLKTVLASDGKLRSKGKARRQSRTADARRATSPRRMLEMLEPRLAMAAELIDTVSFGGQSLGTIAANSTTNKIYLSVGNSIGVLDGDSAMQVGGVPSLGFAYGIAADEQADELFVSHQFAGSVRVIDGATDTIETDIAVPGLVHTIGKVAANSALGHFYSANSIDNSLSVIDVTTGAVLQTVALGLQASEIAVVPGSGKIFAPGPFSLAIVQDAGAPPPRDVDAISGRVWADSNNDGRIDFGEAGLGGATVRLDGVDETGRAVSRSVTTGADGGYQFDHLLPGVYSVRELFATSEYVDGRDSLGTVGGAPVGSTTNDLFTGILLRDGDVGSGYNFGERPAPAGRVRENEVEEIGFWRNSEGQALIRSFNGGAMSTQLGDWLAATLPQTFGSLAGKTNLEVASAYVTVFRAATGPTPKLEAQFFATALNLYATSSELGGAAGACSRFRVTRFGIGASTVNVANSGSAFGLPDRAVGTVLDLLQAADRQSTGGRLYGGNSRLRKMANTVFARINEGE